MFTNLPTRRSIYGSGTTSPIRPGRRARPAQQHGRSRPVRPAGRSRRRRRRRALPRARRRRGVGPKGFAPATRAGAGRARPATDGGGRTGEIEERTDATEDRWSPRDAGAYHAARRDRDGDDGRGDRSTTAHRRLRGRRMEPKPRTGARAGTARRDRLRQRGRGRRRGESGAHAAPDAGCGSRPVEPRSAPRGHGARCYLGADGHDRCRGHGASRRPSRQPAPRHRLRGRPRLGQPPAGRRRPAARPRVGASGPRGRSPTRLRHHRPPDPLARPRRGRQPK